MLSIDYSNIRTDELRSQALAAKRLRAAVLRLDLLHPQLSGNKWFKLRYHLEAAREAGRTTILTFGGAYSNHIAATAAACRLAGFSSVGVIRGEAPQRPGHTLLQAEADGMRLHFVSREEYKRKEEKEYTDELIKRFGPVFIIPEGGGGERGVRGAEEILRLAPDPGAFTHICCAAGTGATLAGLINAAEERQTVIGFPALKGAGFLKQAVSRLLRPAAAGRQWLIMDNYHFGGYARATPALFAFMNEFYRDFNIPLDFVYTGKMAFGMMELAGKDYFPPGSNILMVHSGGLQGNRSLPPGTLAYENDPSLCIR